MISAPVSWCRFFPEIAGNPGTAHLIRGPPAQFHPVIHGVANCGHFRRIPVSETPRRCRDIARRLIFHSPSLLLFRLSPDLYFLPHVGGIDNTLMPRRRPSPPRRLI